MELVWGAPIGMKARGHPVTTVALPPEGTLLAFTDGIVERKGQFIDTGLVQLRGAASGDGRPLFPVVDLISKMTAQGSDDDLAILGMRWTG